MELEVLKKKLNTYRTAKGRLMKIPDELAYEMLLAWEEWTGPASGFYSALGADFRKVAGILGRAKKLKREGRFVDSDFKEVKLVGGTELSSSGTGRCQGQITVKWDKGKVIRFTEVGQLVEFLNLMERKSAA